MQSNLIFLTEEELDKSIYRIMSFDRLKQIFTSRQIALAKPKLWDDPFENFILNSTGVLPDGSEFQIGFRDKYYGQCWTLTKESDALWRIYSEKRNGVKIKSTIRKLFNPLFYNDDVHHKMNGDEYSVSAFIGKVKYSGTPKLISMLKDKDRMSNKIFDNTGWDKLQLFILKDGLFAMKMKFE